MTPRKKIVIEHFGHKDIGITLETYSHVIPSMQWEANQKIEGLATSDPGLTPVTPPSQRNGHHPRFLTFTPIAGKFQAASKNLLEINLKFACF